MSEAFSNTKYSRGVSPVAAITDNTALVSQIIDTANFLHNVFVLITGTLTDADATFTVLVEDGNAANLSDAAAVTNANYLLGTIAGASFTFADDNVVKKIGYIGPKRYVRVTVTPANNTGNFFMAGIWAQSKPRVGPQA
jgi:hypothetical protein